MIKFPKIMGILNVTPDSFSDGGKFFSLDKAVARAKVMLDEGADIIDIGGESTRPGAAEVSVAEEIARTSELIKEIKKIAKNTLISIDTTKYEVAKKAIENGCDIINDISGLEFDHRLADLAAESNKTLILMHIKGTPRTMQIEPFYNNLIEDVYHSLNTKINLAKEKGVNDIIADVGIGFGKTVEHNWELLKNHDYFLKLGVPLLLGISRKSFIGKSFHIDQPEERDLETALIHSSMLNKSVSIIRVHNVKLHSRLRAIYEKLNNS